MPHAHTPFEIEEVSTNFGQRLLPQLVDSRAKANPNQLFGLIAASSDASTFQKFTYSVIANAVNYVAWWLEDNLGRPSYEGQVIAYIGPNDFRYLITQIASIKVGYVIMMPSLRNSDDNYISLFEKTNILALVHCHTLAQKANELQALRTSLKILQIETSSEIFEKSPSSSVYPYIKTWTEAMNDKVLICHTSGSTGNPKPIMYSNDWINTIDAYQKKPTMNGRPISSTAVWIKTGYRVYIGFPFFHLGGLALSLSTIFNGGVLIFGPVTIPVNSKLACDVLKSSKANVSALPPIVYDDMVKYNRQEFLGLTGHLETMLTGSGPLAPTTGDFLAQHVHLAQTYGSTECGFIPCKVPDQEDWEWFDFDGGFGGVVMEHVEGDEYELVIKRDDAYSWCQPVFKTFTNLNEWRTKDLWHKDPHKKMYKFAGRADDVLVLANGEKFNPVGMESIISGSPLVAGAMVVGSQKPQVGLIVQQYGDLPDAELIDEIWEVVQKANRACPAHAKVFKNMIAVSKTPFLRTPKLSLRRGPTVKMQQEIIDALFAKLNAVEDENADADNHAPKIKIPLVSIQQFVIDCAGVVLPGKTIAPSDDFFALGLDSLQTTKLGNLLRSGLKPFLYPAQFSQLAAGLVYSNPTSARLAATLYSLMNPASVNGTVSNDTSERIEALISKYTSNLPPRNNLKANPKTSELHVILTGSTGYLGQYLLLTLLADPKVSKVTCFNRSSTAATIYSSKGGPSLPSSRLEFLSVSFGEPRFGLSSDVYQNLLDSTDAVIHNAWKVNFNHTVDSYESVHIRGVFNFLTLALTAAKPVTVSFISSVSTMMGSAHLHPGSPIPEHIHSDSSFAILGYGQSKYIGERLLDFAAKERGVNTVVLRAGQIAGPREEKGRGRWSKAEWFPTIMQSSKALGIIPRSLGASNNIDWIPVDTIARGAVECLLAIIQAPSTSGAYVFNMVNHAATTWTALVPLAKKSLGVEKEVSFREWVEEIKMLDASDAKEIKRVSALKLLPFYEGLVGDRELKEGSAFENGKARGSSATFAGLEAINGELVARWIGDWGF